jgi:hypothetical protein
MAKKSHFDYAAHGWLNGLPVNPRQSAFLTRTLLFTAEIRVEFRRELTRHFHFELTCLRTRRNRTHAADLCDIRYHRNRGALLASGEMRQ